jgi:hypothetical protein
MDARTLAKSGKALILASGLIAATAIIGAAQDTPIALGTTATTPLSSWYVAPPTGQALLGGHTFDLTAGNLLLLGNGQRVSYTGSYANAKAVYLLLNTSNTYSMWFNQSVVGTVVLTFSDGSTLPTNLTVGGNVREWRTASSLTVNTVLAGNGSTQVWTGSAQPSMGGGTAVIDMLTIAAGGKTLTGVTVNDTNTFGSLRIQLSGLTVELNTPAPTPTCTKNDHAGKPSADKAKNVPHCIATGKDDTETADTEKTDTETADSATAARSND